MLAGAHVRMLRACANRRPAFSFLTATNGRGEKANAGPVGPVQLCCHAHALWIVGARQTNTPVRLAQARHEGYTTGIDNRTIRALYMQPAKDLSPGRPMIG